MDARLIFFVSVISMSVIVLLNLSGAALFGVNDVHDYRKGNRTRLLGTVKFELFMLPFSLFTYFRLIQFAKFMLTYNNDRWKIHCATKYLQLISIGILLWLFLAHLAYFLYFIPDSVPHFLNDLCFFSTGLWYHFVIPLIGLSVLTTVISAMNVINVCHQPVTKCFSKFPSLKTFCLNENMQVAFTLAVALFLSLISFMSRDKLVVKYLSVKVNDLPEVSEDVRFALISDIHAGATVYKEQVAKVVDRLNSELVDGVFFVGDAIDAPRDSIKDRVEPLRFLTSKTFYVSGNHDYYYGNASEWFDLFQQYRFEVLNNRHTYYRSICIAGVSDYSSGRSGLPNHKFDPVKALKGCLQNSTVVVLSHNPASAKEIAFNNAQLRVDLILSGHTHAGQFYTVAPIAYWLLPYFYGLYQISPNTQLFVTAGTFYQGAPMKMFQMSEIWVIALHAAS